MVNRVMEQKALKLQRQIRRLPKPMPDTVPAMYHDNKVRPLPAAYRAEGVVAPRQPNRELMQGYKHRAASLAREDKPGKFTGITPERLLVEQHLARLKQFEADQLSFTILNTRVHRARVYFNPQKTVYLLVYENFRQSSVQSSLPHCSKVELIDKFRANTLQWVHIVSSGSA